ncbi:MAG TPA: nucleoside-diphosphate kinase [Kosmotogaceae bacterium]|nr:MAG: Nucleoside diphosphate kinase [Thermotogales bacterium 46_20]HAA86188.1 nucleoside-diphosphate kinase [Kosmotogaceae bacterium]
MQRTLVFLKPNAIQRRLVGTILSRFEQKGLKLVALKMVSVTLEQARDLYKEHIGKEFFNPLLDFITSGPVVASVFEGLNAVQICRNLVGNTDPSIASPGTIRGDYGITVRKNLLHASDSHESALREIKVFFDEEEIISYSSCTEEHL